MGAGIAGTALACALRGSGLSIVLIDKRTTPLDTARGDHIQPTTIEILRHWGVLEALLAAGAEQRGGTRWYDPSGELLVHVPVTDLPLAYPHFLFLNHELIGEALLKHALQDAAISVQQPVHGWHLEDHNETWRLRLDLPDGESRTLVAPLLVGADGTGSLTRKRLGINQKMHRYTHPIAVLYGRQRHPPEIRTLDVHLSEQRMISVIPRTGGNCKIGFPVSKQELAFWRSASSEEICAQLMLLAPRVDLERATFGAIYPPMAMQTDRWTSPRGAVLLGDACHAMHPARSMGMNTCFRAANHLAAHLRLLPPRPSRSDIEPLLTTYESEFRPEVEGQLAENHRSGLQMDTIAGEGFTDLCAQLRGASASPEARRALALRSAGMSSATST